jgi:hypothetical protein
LLPGPYWSGGVGAERLGLSEGLKQAVRRRRSQDSPARRRARNCSVIWRLVHHQEGTDELDGGEKDPKSGTELAMPRSIRCPAGPGH